MVQFKVINNTVTLDKEITKLDEFVLEIISLIKKYADYVIISGYISIFFGRARGTEDVDMFIKNLSLDSFKELYKELVNLGYDWTIEDPDALYNDYLKSGLPINVWKRNFPLLRMEIKWASKPSQIIAFEDKITVKFKGYELLMSNIESQIAYKRYIAKSEKDLADARHLEVVFQDINQEKIKEYKKLFEREFNEN